MHLTSGSKRPETNIFAAYGSLFLHDLSIFNLEVGGRYNKHEQYGENYTYRSPQVLISLKRLNYSEPFQLLLKFQH